MPRDTGAIALLMLAAALAVGVLRISERVQSQPTSHAPSHSSSQPSHYADLQDSQEKICRHPFLHRTRRVECRLRSEDHPHE